MSRSLVIVALATICQFAHAVNISETVEFKTQNQGMWGSGPATTFLDESVFLGVEWDGYTKNVWGWAPNPSFPAQQYTGFLAADIYAGKLGFEPFVKATAGEIDLNYPVDIQLSAPDQVNPGAQFTVSTNFSKSSSGHNLTTAGTGFELGMDFVMDAKVTFGAGYDDDSIAPGITGTGPVFTSSERVNGSTNDAWGTDVLNGNVTSRPPTAVMDLHRDDITLIDTDGEFRQRVFTIGPGALNYTFNIPGTNGVTGLNIAVPGPLNLSDTTANTAGDLHAQKTGTPFLSAVIDIDQFVVTLANVAGLPIPPLGGTYPADNNSDNAEDDDTFEWSLGKLNYDLADIDFQFGPALRQNIDFDFKKLPITLTASDGQVQHGLLGDDFDFTAPADGSDLTFTATINIDGDIRNRMGFDLTVDIPWSIGRLGLELLGLNLLNFGPLLSGSLGSHSAPIADFYDHSFGLEGFNAVIRSFDVDVVPEPVTALLLLAGSTLMIRRR